MKIQGIIGKKLEMLSSKTKFDRLDDSIEWWHKAVLNQHSSFGVMLGLKVTALAILFGLNPSIFTQFLWLKIVVIVVLVLVCIEIILALHLPQVERENAWKGIENALKELNGKEKEQEELEGEKSVRLWLIRISIASWFLIIAVLISKVVVS